jgi:hypothetical protein
LSAEPWATPAPLGDPARARFSFELGDADLWLLQRGQRQMVAFQVAITVPMCALQFWLSDRAMWKALALFLVVPSFVGALGWALGASRRRAMWALRGPWRVTLHERRLAVSHPSGEWALAWHRITHASTDASFARVFLDDGNLVVIPRRAFATETGFATFPDVIADFQRPAAGELG